MKQIVIVISLLVCLSSVNAKAQTAQEYLKSCVQEAKENGATNLIVKATFCSACEGTFESFIFSKSETTYQVRYIKYFDGYENVRVIKDTTLTDSEIKEIFEITETHQDSIFWQLSNMDSLLTVKVVQDGKTLYRGKLMHGKMRYLELYHNGKTASSLYSVIDLNYTFEKAYYYWLLSSSINNYINDLRE